MALMPDIGLYEKFKIHSRKSGIFRSFLVGNSRFLNLHQFLVEQLHIRLRKSFSLFFYFYEEERVKGKNYGHVRR